MIQGDQLDNLKGRLEAEKEKIKGELEDFKKRLDFGDTKESRESFEEETDETEEFANYLGVKVVLQKRLQNIDMSLEKIKNGTYGKCDKCGKDMGIELLEAEPESEFCKLCKQEEGEHEGGS